MSGVVSEGKNQDEELYCYSQQWEKSRGKQKTKQRIVQNAGEDTENSKDPKAETRVKLGLRVKLQGRNTDGVRTRTDNKSLENAQCK